MSFNYPISLNLDGKKCIVVGGGAVAERKVRSLLKAGARVLVIAPECNTKLQELAADGKVQWSADVYQAELLEKSFLVIAATDDREVNSSIAAYCRERDILVNVVDSREESSFIVNAFFQRGELLIAVSTNGHNPALAQKIKSDLERVYGSGYEEVMELMNQARIKIKETTTDLRQRDQLIKMIINSGVIEMVLAGQTEQAREKVQGCISSFWG